jgi:hypothetical protein
MAIVWAVNNGNWSSASTWSGSYIPQPGDDVYSNNRTVNIDVSFEVASLRNTSGTGITAGGTFNFNSGSISGSITGATPLFVGASNLITITHNTGDVSLTAINGYTLPNATTTIPVIADSCGATFNLTIPTLILNVTNNTSNRVLISKTGNGTLNLNSNLSHTGAGDAVQNNRLLEILAGNVIITGTIQGPPGNYSNAASSIVTINQTSGNLKIIGNIPAPTATGQGTMRVVFFSGTTFELTGSITGGTSNATGVITSATNINISGSVIGGTATNALSISSAATINITGPIIAGSSAAAISSTGAHTLIYSGSLAASAGSPAIISTNINATNIFTGPFYNNGAVMAVQVGRMFLSSNSTEWQFTSDAIGVSQSLYTADLIPTYPSASDVRLGTSYSSGSLTGTLAMPQASSVQFGVPVDNTTGSAVLTTASLASAIWDRSRSELSTTGSIGERLQNVATPSTVGTQISSYLL